MAVGDINSNALFGENGAGKLYIATDYDNTVYDQGDGTNEDEAITDLETYTFADVGYFENFRFRIQNGDQKVIETDYCGIGELLRKGEKIVGFSVDVQEILEMDNLALILGLTLNETVANKQILGMKRTQQELAYHLFKFQTCAKEFSNTNELYFVKAVLSGDVDIPIINLNRNDFVGVTLDFEVANGGNFFLQKGVATS